MGKKCLPFSSWVAGVPEQTASQPCPRRLLLLDPQQRPGEAMPQPSRPWPKGLSAQQLRPQSCSLRRVETRLRKEGDRSHRLAARGLEWPLFPVGATVCGRVWGLWEKEQEVRRKYIRELWGEKIEQLENSTGRNMQWGVGVGTANTAGGVVARKSGRCAPDGHAGLRPQS